MTKQLYIKLRTTNDFSIAYNYYKEKGGTLSMQEFLTYMPLSGANLNMAYQIATSHYDNMFNVTALLDKNGQLIKYY